MVETFELTMTATARPAAKTMSKRELPYLKKVI